MGGSGGYGMPTTIPDWMSKAFNQTVSPGTLQNPMPPTAPSALLKSPSAASADTVAIPSSTIPDMGASASSAASAAANAAKAPDAGKWGLEDWNTLIKGVGTLGNLGLGIYSAINAGQMFDFQKNLANTNLQNQATAYNTALEDKMRGRYSLEYYNANKDQIEKQIAERRAKAGG